MSLLRIGAAGAGFINRAKIARAGLSGLLLLALAACTGQSEYLREALNPAAQTQGILADGERYDLVSISTGDAPAMKTIYFISGSGCASLRSFMNTYFKDLPPGYRIYGLEKQGVNDRSLGLTCSDAFWQNYRYETLLRRGRKGLDLVTEQTGGPVAAIIGVSEGGPIAAELAADAPGSPALIMLASGGLPQRAELEVLAAKRGESAKLAELLARIAESPDSVSERSLGMPHRYWTSVLDADPGPALRRLTQSALIIIGEKDENVPVASAEKAHELAPASELVILPGASHTFQSPAGNQRRAVMTYIDRFLREEQHQ